MTRRIVPFAAVCLLLLLSVTLVVSAGDEAAPLLVPVGTSFTYQGYLEDGGLPADADYDFEFGLYDASVAGSPVGSPVALENVAVVDGQFSVELDFGDVFDGTALWLEIGVRPWDSTGAYTTLSPRQALSAVPYAHYAVNIPLAGSGSAATASRSDHDHFGGSFSGASSGNALYVQNSGSGDGIWGQSLFPGGIGVRGYGSGTTGFSIGVYGNTASGSGYGVFGFTTVGDGVGGESQDTSGRGVFGNASATTGTNYGVYGQSASTNGHGVYGAATATSGFTYGVYGQSSSTKGHGVSGAAEATTGFAIGVYGSSASTSGSGVYGYAGTTSGVTYGVYGESSSDEGRGVYGEATATSGANYGVWGYTASTNGHGVYGSASATSGVNYGVYAVSESTEGTGVYGSTSATSGPAIGVEGISYSTSGYGVRGSAVASSGTTYGVYGYTASTSGYAGYFVGDVYITGTLTKGGGSFKIDHPLDPANKYLYHSFVESPDMKDIYDGVVTLDADGTAWVQLPDWFEALNQDFRYQLTPVGAAMPDLHVAQEIRDNAFRIAGGVPGLKVSWQVTGIRHDPYADDHRIPVEQDKPADEVGTYLYPQGYGQPDDLALYDPLHADDSTPIEDEASPVDQ